MPDYPRDVYMKDGSWVSWSDFLGDSYAYNHRLRRVKWKTYDEAKVLMRALGFGSFLEYAAWTRQGGKIEGVPRSNVKKIYGDAWQGWQGIFKSNQNSSRLLSRVANPNTTTLD